MPTPWMNALPFGCAAAAAALDRRRDGDVGAGGADPPDPVKSTWRVRHSRPVPARSRTRGQRPAPSRLVLTHSTWRLPSRRQVHRHLGGDVEGQTEQLAQADQPPAFPPPCHQHRRVDEQEGDEGDDERRRVAGPKPPRRIDERQSAEQRRPGRRAAAPSGRAPSPSARAGPAPAPSANRRDPTLTIIGEVAVLPPHALRCAPGRSCGKALLTSASGRTAGHRRRRGRGPAACPREVAGGERRARSIAKEKPCPCPSVARPAEPRRRAAAA